MDDLLQFLLIYIKLFSLLLATSLFLLPSFCVTKINKNVSNVSSDGSTSYHFSVVAIRRCFAYSIVASY